MVALPLLSRTWGECSTSHSPPPLLFLSYFLSFFFFFGGGGGEVEISSRTLLAHTTSTLYARISLQWLSEPRRLWPTALDSVSGKVELASDTRRACGRSEFTSSDSRDSRMAGRCLCRHSTHTGTRSYRVSRVQKGPIL